MYGISCGDLEYLIALCMMRGKYGEVSILVQALIFLQVHLTWFDLQYFP